MTNEPQHKSLTQSHELTGTSSDTRTSTANADGTTVTASSGATTSPGGGTHTTNGVAAPPVGHGNFIPEDTTRPEHIDLATRRVENLEKIAAKRKLNPHEQDIYDNALRVRDRNAPAQPGDRNNPLPPGNRDTPNPQDLVMAGGDAPISQTQSAAADAPPPAAPAQPANAIGSTINGPSTANPDTPHSSTKNGSDNTSTPSSPQQQQQVATQGSGPANTAINGNGQPPLGPSAPSQASDLPSLPQSGPPPAPTHRFGSPPEHADPRLKEAFKNWPHGWDEQGFPNSPKTLPEGHDLLQPTHKKDTAILPADHHLVQAGLLPAGKAVPRSALHAAIMNYIIHRAAPMAPGVRPTIYVSGGGGGAGKSTILNFLHQRGDLNTDGAVEINADDIKELIPEYDAVKATGDGRAADVVHEESSAISKSLLERAMSAHGPRFNIVYDATLANAPKTRQLFTDWRARGYNIHLVGVTIDPREGITRAFLRAKDSGRWVPASVLKSAHDGFNAAVKEYADIADSANIYDNTQSVPVKIASKTPSQPQLSVVNKALWDTINTRNQ